MTHRAEQVAAAVLSAVTGLATTGAHAFRDRAETLDRESAELPAVLVWHGEDEVVDVLSHDVLVCTLEIFVDAVTSATGGDVQTLLNAIRSEVTVALAADYQLGLPGFVEGMQEIGTDRAVIEDGEETDRALAMMRQRWLATYRRSRTDPGS